MLPQLKTWCPEFYLSIIATLITRNSWKKLKKFKMVQFKWYQKRSQLAQITNTSRTLNLSSRKLITKSLRYSSLITTKKDSAFLLVLLDNLRTILRCQPTWQVLTTQLHLVIGGIFATKMILQI